MPQIPPKRPHIQWMTLLLKKSLWGLVLSSLSAVFLVCQVCQVYVAKAFYVLVYRPAPQPAFFEVFPPFSRLISYSKCRRKHVDFTCKQWTAWRHSKLLSKTLQKARGFYFQTINSLASLKTALNGRLTLRSANLGVSESRPKQSEKHVLSNGKMY